MVEEGFQVKSENSNPFQDCLDEADPADSVLNPERGGRSQLLTDKDPLLGGLQALSDAAGTRTRPFPAPLPLLRNHDNLIGTAGGRLFLQLL